MLILYCGDGETYVLGRLCTSVIIKRETLINLLVCYTISDNILHGERLSKRGLSTFQFLLCLVFDVRWALNDTGTCT